MTYLQHQAQQRRELSQQGLQLACTQAAEVARLSAGTEAAPLTKLQAAPSAKLLGWQLNPRRTQACWSAGSSISPAAGNRRIKAALADEVGLKPVQPLRRTRQLLQVRWEGRAAGRAMDG